MVIPLTQQEVELLLDLLKTERGCNPLDVITAVEIDKYQIQDQLFLSYMAGEKGGVLYLCEDTPDPLMDTSSAGQYIVYVNGTPMFSRDRLFKAAWLADKLCHILFNAKEIRVYDNGRGVEIIKWVRLTAHINAWIGGRQ